MLSARSLPNSHDDTVYSPVLTISYESLETLKINTKNRFTQIKQYCSNYNLVLNVSKSSSCLHHQKQNYTINYTIITLLLCKLHYYTTQLGTNKTTKHLDILIDSKLSWKPTWLLCCLESHPRYSLVTMGWARGASLELIQYTWMVLAETPVW